MLYPLIGNELDGMLEVKFCHVKYEMAVCVDLGEARLTSCLNETLSRKMQDCPERTQQESYSEKSHN